MTLYATESAVADWPGVEPPPGRPERLRAAEAVAEGGAEHGLGTAIQAARRVADAAVAALGQAPATWVPLRVLGDALVAPVVGARFDPDDHADMSLVRRLLAVWGRRLLRFGAEVGELDDAGERVRIVRAPSRNDDVGVRWPQIAPRADLARWAHRSAPPDLPSLAAVEMSSSLVAALTPDPDRLARGYAAVREIRERELAAGRPWPPEIIEGHGWVFSRTVHRPRVVANGLTAALPLCADPDVPCVPVTRGRWTCPACGAVTVVPEPVTGARLPECDCYPAVCAHPGARPARSRRAGGHDDR